MEALHLDLVIQLPALMCLLIMLWFINRLFFKSSGKKNFPPSPPKLPIIGNLHQLSSLPHQDLQSMAKKYGPLMLLHFGSVPVLVVSSADAAREIMKTHDLNFASRPLYKNFKKLVYDCKDVGLAPYGEYWRHVRSILVVHLLSNKRVQSFRSIREEETEVFMKKIGESSGPVDLSKMFDEFTNNRICRSAFGRKYTESEKGKNFLVLMKEQTELIGSINIGDYIPWLSWINHVNGVDKRVDKLAKEMDDFLEVVIQERIETLNDQSSSASNNNNKVFYPEGTDKVGDNFADKMVEIYNEKTDDLVNRDSIKALILDVFAGGSDTISTSLEWAMSELLRHPTAMENLQNEVQGIVQDKHEITDEDLERMDYLKAVIKETLRLHPPAPTLLPRVAAEDVKIKGYDVSAGTIVMTNVWAMGRDSELWEEAEKFRPERFLNSSIDFRGMDFELIPFGAGRRSCPGIAFAVSTIEFTLANLVRKFNWKLPEGKYLDMSETPGLTAHRSVPLLAVASPTK